MATGATGTPTTLGIPKYATSADAPNGTGFNAAMDAIDALISKTPGSDRIAGIATGSVPVWNGTAWVKPSGTPDGTKFLRDDGSWQPMGGAWQSWTPTKITQDSTDNTNIFGAFTGRYVQVGKVVHLMMGATATGAGTASQSLTVVGLPVAPINNTSLLGVARYAEAGANDWLLSPVAVASTNVRFLPPGVPATFFGVGAGSTVAAGDQLFLNLTYEVA